MALSLFNRHVGKHFRYSSSCSECFKFKGLSLQVSTGLSSSSFQAASKNLTSVIGRSSSTFLIQRYPYSSANLTQHRQTNGNHQCSFDASRSLTLMQFLSKSSSSQNVQVSTVSSLFDQMVQRRLYSTDGSQLPKGPQAKADKENALKSPISWKTLAIVAAISGVLVWNLKSVREEKEQRMKNQKQVGKPLLGGPWKLTDHHGNPRASEDFHGQWILIYFGFTNCPDICPDYLEKIVNFLSKMETEKSLPSVQVVFITVDPDRDTPATLKEYLSEFSPKMLGMSGTIDEVNKATRAYRVYYSAGPKDEDGDYIVDHSIISYLVGPDGNFVDYFGQNKTAEEMFDATKSHIHKYKKNNPS